MNTQQIFNKVVRHLLRQGRRAWSNETGCQYLDDRGNKCAVGCLIKKPFYSRDMEGLGLTNGKVRPIVEKSIGRKLTSLEYNMLISLQNAHDQTQDNQTHLWRGEFERIAERCGLEFPRIRTDNTSAPARL